MVLVKQPLPMPHDAKEYSRKYSLTNFINAYYQIRDCLNYAPSKVLLVGVGVGLETIILREKFGILVSTIDIDSGFSPDFIGSVHSMEMFSDMQFDVAIVSHVLEHLPFSFFSTSLKELARVAKHAIIYLPYGGRHLEWKFSYAQRCREFSFKLTIPPLKKTTGELRELQNGEHYWECGYRNFSVMKISRIISNYFEIDGCYQNPDWKYSINFKLTSKQRDRK